MHLYANLNMQKYAPNMQQYAVPNLEYAGICTNRQIRNMQYMCTTRSNILKYAKQNMDIFANILCA